jgi:hypothetical protein
MNPKKILSKEISQKVKGQISEETVSENVDQFFRHGNMFLFLELMLLRKEVKSLRKELQQWQDDKIDSPRKLMLPELF